MEALIAMPGLAVLACGAYCFAQSVYEALRDRQWWWFGLLAAAILMLTWAADASMQRSLNEPF